MMFFEKVERGQLLLIALGIYFVYFGFKIIRDLLKI